MTPRITSTSRLLRGGLLFLATLAVVFATPIKFDIPAQPAPAALQLFIRQSGVQVLYVADDLKAVTANAVAGEYEPAAALNLLLKGTGYVGATTKAGSFTVVREKAEITTGSVRGSLTGEGGRGASGVLVTIRETAQSAETDRYGVFVFPNVAAGTYVLVASAPGYQTMHITDVQVKAGRDLTIGKEEMRRLGEGVLKLEPFVVHADTVEQLEKFEVTASKPQPFSDRNVDLPRTENDVQPYYIFDSQAIEESGTTSVEDFLRQRLTMNTTVQTNGQRTASSIPNGGSFGLGNVNPNNLNLNTTSSINLNGLGADHTLILVNGRPMPGVAVFSGTGGIATPGQPDVNGIPLAAIERIEVLPSSAGAIYGASAAGGVINIILKKAYTGGDISATYASTWDGHGPSRTLEVTYGKSFNHGKTQLFVTAQYSDASPLLLQDRRELYDRGTNAILVSDPDFFYGNTNGIGSGQPFLGSEPNFRVSGASLLTFKGTNASFGSSYGTVPAGFTASSNPSLLIPGQWNFTPPETNQGPTGLLQPLGSYPRRKAIMATLTHDLTDKFQVHMDYSYNENHSRSEDNTYGIATFLPAAAPGNPFNQDITVTYPINYTAPATSNSITNAITIGGTLKLPFDWVAHLDYQWAKGSFEYRNVIATGFGKFAVTPTFGTVGGVNDPNPTPFWNGYSPLFISPASPVSLDPFLQYYAGSSKSTSNDLILAASGPLAHLPWGEPQLSVRLEHNKSNQPDGNTRSNGPVGTPYLGLPNAQGFTYVSYATGQTIDSANAELDLPIFKTKTPLLHALDVQFNVSMQQSTAQVGTPGYEIIPDYPYTTAPTTPGTYILAPNTLSRSSTQLVSTGAQPYRQKAKFSSTSITGPALSYKPVDDIIIRASVASGYVPPTYAQLLPTNFLQAPSTTRISDPKTGSSYSITSYSLGGNPDLKPTTSKSWDFGLVWQPHAGLLKGLRLDAEFIETKQFNQILDPGVQGFINLASFFPNQVVRDPTSGLITTVYDKYINVAVAKQSAWTYTLDYERPTSIGSFSLSAAATIQEHNQQQLVAGGPLFEYVGYPSEGGDAKVKSTATLRWNHHDWVAAWTVVHFGSYQQAGSPSDLIYYGGNPYGFGSAASPFFDNTYTAAQGGNTIPSQIYHNLYLSYSFPKDPFDRGSNWGRWTDALLHGMKVSLVVNNVFNTLPPLDAYYAPFFVSPFGDIQLRNYAITLKKSF